MNNTKNINMKGNMCNNSESLTLSNEYSLSKPICFESV